MQRFEPNVFVGPSFLCVRAAGEQLNTKQGKNMLVLCSQVLYAVGAQLVCYPISNPDHVVASLEAQLWVVTYSYVLFVCSRQGVGQTRFMCLCKWLIL